MPLHISRTRRTLVVGLAVAGTVCLAGCASEASQVTHSQLGAGFGAGSDFLAPPSSETYVVHRSPSPEVSPSPESSSEESTVPEVDPAVIGTFVISDGIMSSAHIAATADNDVDFEFELTEPVLFERQGRISPMIVSVGSLTAESLTYPEVRVTFEPYLRDDATLMNTTIDVPDSVTGSSPFSTSSIVLELTLEPSVAAHVTDHAQP